MSCFNFGREDEDFPFEEEALRFFKGKIPGWDTLEFKVPTWKEEVLSRLRAFKNALEGSDEEPLIDYLIRVIERGAPSGDRLKVWRYLVEEHLFPLLERLIFYRVNEPLGEEELSFKIKEVGELPGHSKVKTPADAIGRIIALLSLGGEDD